MTTPSSFEREATIQLSDTFSDFATPPGTPPIADFDSILTAQVRNTGRWADVTLPLGSWPHTGDYAAVLITALRDEQKRLLNIYEESGQHCPDSIALQESLRKGVVGIINCAPRTQEHRATGKNGEDFYLAELNDNVQIFSQLQFLAGIARRGLIKGLWRVRDDNLVWPKGEQFRSSIVSQLRNFPECLEPEPRTLEALSQEVAKPFITVAFADKYGNCRLENPQGIKADDLTGRQLSLIIGDEKLTVYGVSRLTEIPEDKLGVYINPADHESESSPQYIELARRVSNPNDTSRSAYETLRRAVTSSNPDQQHIEWQHIHIGLKV